MVSNCVHVIFLTVILSTATPSLQDSLEQPSEVPIKDRINLLKFQIKDQLKGQKDEISGKPIVNEDYEYVERTNKKLTPIMSDDQRKKEHRYRLRELKTTTTTLEPGFATKPSVYFKKDNNKVPAFLNPPHRPKGRLGKNEKQKIPKIEKPRDIFYRRHPSEDNGKGKGQKDERGNGKKSLRAGDEENGKGDGNGKSPLERQYRWTHCQDMVTPYLTGIKCNMTQIRRLNLKDRIVLRLFELLTTNTENFTRVDMEALMYQISNLPIRLYQWDVHALQMLVQKISAIGDSGHSKSTHKVATYWSLKKGLQTLFRRWDLDLGDTVNLLRDTRIIRPPCISININSMSTEKTLPTMYTPPTRKTKRPKTTTAESDEE